jgi:phospholipid transport system substrate-binding protein
LAVSALVWLTAARPADAKAPSPAPWLTSTVERVKNLATRKVKPESPEETKWKKEVKAAVDDIMDWPELTERSLGRYWAERTPKEREEFSKLLREVVEASYESKMKLASRDQLKKPQEVTIDWQKEKIDGNLATATASVTADKSKTDLVFQLKYDGKRWRVYDFSIDGASTVDTYRSQFTKIISKQGFPALLDRLRKKITEIRSGKGEIQ